jgi:hypothetical protein
MKRIALMVPLFLSLLHSALAGSIPREEVSADAKWLIHLEAAQFRATKVGGFVVTQMVEKVLSRPIEQMSSKLKLDVNVEKIIEGINSITIYGTDYQSPEEHSVLLIRASPELEKILVGFLAGMALAGTNAPIPVTQTQDGGVSFYAIGDAAYCAVLPGKVIAIGRSREVSENAAKVLTGKAPNLASGAAFTEFGEPKEAFFFLGVAEGFNLGNNLPPQAKLLQAADGGRIVLGEEADQLFLHLALRGKSSDVVTQMQQVVQGLIAIGSLSQPQNEDLAHLLHSIQVSTKDNIVNVGVDFPVDRAIGHLTQLSEKMAHKHDHSTAVAESNGKMPKPSADVESPSTVGNKKD